MGERIYLNALIHRQCYRQKFKQTRKWNPSIPSEQIRLSDYIKPISYELWMHILEEPKIIGNVSIVLEVSGYENQIY